MNRKQTSVLLENSSFCLRHINTIVSDISVLYENLYVHTWIILHVIRVQFVTCHTVVSPLL